MLQWDQKGFFRTLKVEEAHQREMPEMKKFVEFWGGIWERERKNNPIYAIDGRDKKTTE